MCSSRSFSERTTYGLRSASLSNFHLFPEDTQKREKNNEIKKYIEYMDHEIRNVRRKLPAFQTHNKPRKALCQTADLNFSL